MHLRLQPTLDQAAFHCPFSTSRLKIVPFGVSNLVSSLIYVAHKFFPVDIGFGLCSTLCSLPFSARTHTSNLLSPRCAACDCSLSTSPLFNAVCSHCSHQYRKLIFLFSRPSLLSCQILSCAPQCHLEFALPGAAQAAARCLTFDASLHVHHLYLAPPYPPCQQSSTRISTFELGSRSVRWNVSCIVPLLYYFISLCNHFVEHPTLEIHVDGSWAIIFFILPPL